MGAHDFFYEADSMKSLDIFYSFHRSIPDGRTAILRNDVEPLLLPSEGIRGLRATRFEWG